VNRAALLWFGPYETLDEADVKCATDPELIAVVDSLFGRFFAVPRVRLAEFATFLIDRVRMECDPLASVYGDVTL
jgi:hypothetical protein